MRLVFGFLFLIAYLVRSAVRWGLYGGTNGYAVFRQCAEIFRRISAGSGGQFLQTHRRRLIYITADRNLEVEVNCESICRMKIRVNRSFPFSASFLRFPGLVYAFVEAFLSSNQRIEESQFVAHSSTQETISELKNRPGFLPLMKQLSQYGASIKFGNHGAVVWKPVRREDLNEEAILRLFRILEDVTSICANEPIEIPIQPLNSEKRCAYCKEQVNGEESLRYCTHCGTPHHSDCFELNGGCTTFGCSEAIQTQRRYDAPTQQRM